jgi:hypothetical protein
MTKKNTLLIALELFVDSDKEEKLEGGTRISGSMVLLLIELSGKLFVSATMLLEVVDKLLGRELMVILFSIIDVGFRLQTPDVSSYPSSQVHAPPSKILLEAWSHFVHLSA